ncbi:hypothetical protein FKP32DRAFT_1361810 [Trametes sanguinea]|nr:hypothetical protein FKP32DRAFT_1361810 [Trametes sanguinea]
MATHIRTRPSLENLPFPGILRTFVANSCHSPASLPRHSHPPTPKDSSDANHHSALESFAPAPATLLPAPPRRMLIQSLSVISKKSTFFVPIVTFARRPRTVSKLRRTSVNSLRRAVGALNVAIRFAAARPACKNVDKPCRPPLTRPTFAQRPYVPIHPNITEYHLCISVVCACAATANLFDPGPESRDDLHQDTSGFLHPLIESGARVHPWVGTSSSDPRNTHVRHTLQGRHRAARTSSFV